MFCTKCGQSNEADANFCQSCGARLIPVPTGSSPPPPAPEVTPEVPRAAPATPSPNERKAESAILSRYYSALCALFLLQLLVPAFFPKAFQTPWIPLCFMAAYGFLCYRLAKALGKHDGWTYGLLAAIPIINLVVLIVLLRKTGRRLKELGVVYVQRSWLIGGLLVLLALFGLFAIVTYNNYVLRQSGSGTVPPQSESPRQNDQQSDANSGQPAEQLTSHQALCERINASEAQTRANCNQGRFSACREIAAHVALRVQEGCAREVVTDATDQPSEGQQLDVQPDRLDNGSSLDQSHIQATDAAQDGAAASYPAAADAAQGAATSYPPATDAAQDAAAAPPTAPSHYDPNVPIRVSGRFEYLSDETSLEIKGNQICFFPDANSVSRIPRRNASSAEFWFCFDNGRAAAHMLGITMGQNRSNCGYQGTATIEVTNYIPFYGESDADNDAATLRLVIVRTPARPIACQN